MNPMCCMSDIPINEMWRRKCRTILHRFTSQGRAGAPMSAIGAGFRYGVFTADNPARPSASACLVCTAVTGVSRTRAGGRPEIEMKQGASHGA